VLLLQRKGHLIAMNAKRYATHRARVEGERGFQAPRQGARQGQGERKEKKEKEPPLEVNMALMAQRKFHREAERTGVRTGPLSPHGQQGTTFHLP